MNPSRIAITSMGALCALGSDVEAMTDALISGKQGIGPLLHLDLGFPELVFGEVALSNADLLSLLKDKVKDPPRSRTALLALVAALQAVGDEHDERNTVVISASTVGGMDLSEEHFSDWQKHDLRNAAVAMEHPVGSHTTHVAHAIGSKAMHTTISTACSSSANAMILGAQLLRTGRADRVLVGGADALCRFTVEGFRALSAMDTGRTKPFSNERNGMNLGEAAAYLVLEREADILKGGREPLAFLSGGANRNDAHHQTATSSEGRGPYAAMHDAIAMAGIAPEEVDHINAHGTGTENNDITELAAMERLFTSVPEYTSTKALTGHTLAAAGALEAVISVICMREGIVPVGYPAAEAITGHSALPVARSVRRPVRNVLSNSFGFGGNDSALFFTSTK